MSDVLIKNMEMPKNCFDCPCHHHKRDDGYYDYEICRASGTAFNDGYSSVTGHKGHSNPFEARLDNCPLVPVPPHGRLIDADKLLKESEYIVDEVVIVGRTLIPIKEIYNAPTIIEAEDGE